jgi:molybdopterin-guanine dinucleotide biosynthesis protein A
LSEPQLPPRPVGLVLAGGRARRMGGGLKALLPFRGRPLLRWSLEALEPHCERLLISANEPEPFAELDLPVVPDRLAGRGPLAGIHAGLCAAEGASLLVMACDLPLIRAEDLAPLLEAAPGADVVVWGHERGLEPLAAWYGPGALPVAESLLLEGVCKVSALFPRLRTTVLHWPGPLERFANVNTPDELARLQQG